MYFHWSDHPHPRVYKKMDPSCGHSVAISLYMTFCKATKIVLFSTLKNTLTFSAPCKTTRNQDSTTACMSLSEEVRVAKVQFLTVALSGGGVRLAISFSFVENWIASSMKVVLLFVLSYFNQTDLIIIFIFIFIDNGSGSKASVESRLHYQFLNLGLVVALFKNQFKGQCQGILHLLCLFLKPIQRPVSRAGSMTSFCSPLNLGLAASGARPRMTHSEVVRKAPTWR